jgi:PAS domain S-box-containing protein
VQIQAQLREKEEQYRGIFEATSDGVAIIDFDGRVIEVNPALCAMFGYRHDELIGLHAGALTHPDYRHLLPESLSILATGGSVQVQAMSTRKDGTPFHAESNATIFTYKGQPHILGVVRDITERVRAQELLEQRVAERTHELSTLLEVSHNVASTLEVQPLLGLILDQLNMVVEYTGAGIAVQDGMMVRIIAYRGPDSDERPLGPIPVAQAGSLWQWMRQSEPVRIPDVRADTPIARIYQETVGDAVYTSLSHVRSWMAVPMRVKDRDIGSLFLEHSMPDAYTEHHMSLTLAIAQHAAIAMENARLYEQAQAVAVLEERQRLARELHDSVSQALYGIGLGVHTAQLLLARDPARVLETLDYVRDLAQAGLAEMRALIFELLPEALESEGLVAALEKQMAAVRARHGIAINATLGTEPDMPLVVKEAIYRIAQEALHNMVKHAQARTVELRLEVRAEELALEVRDDGAGFDPRGKFPGHLGLRTMRERATRLGGTLELESAPGQGTCIRASVPCRLA